MALPKLKDLSHGLFAGVTAAAMVMAPMQAANAQQAQPVAVSQINVPMSDARNIGERSVRVVAAQETDRAMNIALFGVERDAWPRLRGAIQQGVANGCAVRAVFMGPTDAEPALEIYAKGKREVLDGTGLQGRSVVSRPRPRRLRAVDRQAVVWRWFRMLGDHGVYQKFEDGRGRSIVCRFLAGMIPDMQIRLNLVCEKEPQSR